MPNTSKKAAKGNALQEMRERADFLQWMSTLGDEAQKDIVVSPAFLSTLLHREIGTLVKDRAARAKAPDKSKIDPASYASLPHIAPAKGEREIQYRAYDVVAFIKRRSDDANLSRGAPEPRGPAALGFQSWLAYGGADEEWPFCIQPDGRPMPMGQALATGCATDDAVRLTIGAYGKQLADAVSLAHAEAERNALEESTKRAKKKTVRTSAAAPAAKPAKRERWKEPGGPV